MKIRPPQLTRSHFDKDFHHFFTRLIKRLGRSGYSVRFSFRSKQADLVSCRIYRRGVFVVCSDAGSAVEALEWAVWNLRHLEGKEWLSDVTEGRMK